MQIIKKEGRSQSEHDGLPEFRRQKLKFGTPKWVEVYTNKYPRERSCAKKERSQGIIFKVFHQILSCGCTGKAGEL